MSDCCLLCCATSATGLNTVLSSITSNPQRNSNTATYNHTKYDYSPINWQFSITGIELSSALLFIKHYTYNAVCEYIL